MKFISEQEMAGICRAVNRSPGKRQIKRELGGGNLFITCVFINLISNTVHINSLVQVIILNKQTDIKLKGSTGPGFT